MALTLGIDTASTELSLGLYEDATPVASYVRYRKNSHAEHIASSIEFFLSSNNVAPEAISRIGIAVGPGSFTGLRIGIAFVKGFCFGREVPILGVSSLMSVASSIPSLGKQLLIAFDARRDQVHYQRFKSESGKYVPTDKQRYAPSTVVAQTLVPGEIVIVDTLGFAKSVLPSLFSAEHPDVFSTDTLSLQRGLACAKIAATLDEHAPNWVSSMEVEPLYEEVSFTRAPSGV